MASYQTITSWIWMPSVLRRSAKGRDGHVDDVTGVRRFGQQVAHRGIVSFSASRKGAGGDEDADAVSPALIKATGGLM